MTKTAQALNSHVKCYGEERQGRYFSEEFGKWYDLYPCKVHGFHVDIDYDNEW